MGTVAAEYDPFRLVTDGDVDTELGIYSEMTGNLIESNDDSLSEELRDTLRAEINLVAGLPHGDYIAAVGSFNTTYEDQYEIIAVSGAGNYRLDVEGITIDGVLAADELAYIGFTVAPPNVDINDCDQDGAVGLSDTLCATPFTIERVLSAANLLQGDADGNGEVNFADFLTLSGNFGNDGDYTDGNFDLQGGVEFADFLILSSNFGQTSPIGAATVPEPSSLMLMLVFGISMCVVRTR